jgi:CheY-specific phosphatase CheX
MDTTQVGGANATRIGKYVLLVDPPRGPLSALAEQLKGLEFHVAQVPDKHACRRFLQRFPKLGLLAVNAAEADSLSDFLEEIGRSHPHLPVLLLAKESGAIRNVDGEWKVGGLRDPNELQARVAETLHEDNYPNHLIRSLSFAIEEALGGFDNHAAPGQVYLRATNTTLDELTALIPFSGPRVEGYLAIATAKATAIRLHANLFPNAAPPDDHALNDLLGELCNRVIGRFHGPFEAHAMSFDFGIAVYSAGRSELRTAEGHPALVVEFETPAGVVNVELYVDRPLPQTSAFRLEDSAESGAFVLL